MLLNAITKTALPGKQSCGRPTRSMSLGTLMSCVASSPPGEESPGGTAGLSFFLMKERLRWTLPKTDGPTESVAFSFDTKGGTWTCRTSASNTGKSLLLSCWCFWESKGRPCMNSTGLKCSKIILWNCRCNFASTWYASLSLSVVAPTTTQATSSPGGRWSSIWSQSMCSYSSLGHIIMGLESLIVGLCVRTKQISEWKTTQWGMELQHLEYMIIRSMAVLGVGNRNFSQGADIWRGAGFPSGWEEAPPASPLQHDFQLELDSELSCICTVHTLCPSIRFSSCDSYGAHDQTFISPASNNVTKV